MYHDCMVMFDSLFAQGGLSLDRLRALVLVQEAGSIVDAAPDSTSKQSQLSRQLSELEEFFGRSIKERRGRKVVLNAAGRALAEHARWSLAGFENLLANRTADPPLTLAAGDAVLHWLVLPRIASVGARFSVLGLPADEVISRLREGSVDVGLVRRDELEAPLLGRALGTLSHALFVPRGLAPGEDGEDGELLFKVPLAVQTSDSDFLDGLGKLASKQRRSLDVALACETFPQVFRAVQSGKYAGILPTLAAAELPRARQVDVGRFASRLHLAWDPRLERVRPDVRATLRTLGEVLRIGARLQPVQTPRRPSS